MSRRHSLAASLRGDTADVLLTIPEEKRTDLNTLVAALELRFGNQHLKNSTRAQLKSRRQISGESLQELASEIERISLIAFPDYPADVRNTLSLERCRMPDAKDLKTALVFSMNVEAALLASGKDPRPVHTVAVHDTAEVLERRLPEIGRFVRFHYPDRREPKEPKIS